MKNKITIFNNNNNNKIIEIDDKLRDLWKKNKVFNNFSPFLILLIVVVVAFQFFKLIILFLSVRFDLHFSKQNPEFLYPHILLNVFILQNNRAHILDWQVRVERIYICIRILLLYDLRLDYSIILTFNFSDDAKTKK